MRLCMAVGFQWRSWKLKIMQFNECTETKKKFHQQVYTSMILFFFYIKTSLLLNEQCIFFIIFPLFFQYFYTFFLDQNICLGIHINLLACFFFYYFKKCLNPLRSSLNRQKKIRFDLSKTSCTLTCRDPDSI